MEWDRPKKTSGGGRKGDEMSELTLKGERETETETERETERERKAREREKRARE